METGSKRPWVDRFVLMGDAFLYAAALDILVSVVFMAVAVGTGFAAQQMSPNSPLAIVMQGGFMLSVLVVVGFGAFSAWRLRGRTVTLAVGVAMVLGVIVGFSVALPLFGMAAFALSKIPIGSPDGPPWLAIGVMVAAVVALLAMPVIDAIRDLVGAKAHARVDWLRLGALAVVAGIAGIALPVVGAIGNSEVAEAGIFMVPFSAAAAFAVLGADLYCGIRNRKAVRPPLPTA